MVPVRINNHAKTNSGYGLNSRIKRESKSNPTIKKLIPTIKEIIMLIILLLDIFFTNNLLKRYNFGKYINHLHQIFHSVH